MPQSDGRDTTAINSPAQPRRGHAQRRSGSRGRGRERPADRGEATGHEREARPGALACRATRDVCGEEGRRNDGHSLAARAGVGGVATRVGYVQLLTWRLLTTRVRDPPHAASRAPLRLRLQARLRTWLWQSCMSLFLSNPWNRGPCTSSGSTRPEVYHIPNAVVC